ncbi:hypothetical protein D3C87_976000 [compost metagenome]
MSILHVALFALIALAALALFAKLAPNRRSDRESCGSGAFLVDAKPYFFFAAENRFFATLVPVAQALDLVVFPKVGLNDIFKDRKGADRGQYNRYAQMHVDYLLVTRKDFKPVVGIELDGSSHQGEKQKARDQKKAAVFKAAGLPLVRFFNLDKFSESEVRTKLEDVVGAKAWSCGG